MDDALARINSQIQTLRRRADTLRINSRAAALQKIIRQMHEFQISPAEIQAAHGTAKSTGRKRKPAAERAGSRRLVAPKYRHPESGDTWSGRGRAPRWLVAAERAGAERSQFRV